MIRYIIFVMTVYLMSCIFGYPLMMLFETRKTKVYRALICPMIGLTIGMMLMYYLNILELSVSSIAIPVIIAFSLITIVVYVFCYKKNNYTCNDQRGIKQNRWWIVSIIILISTTIMMSIPGANNNNNLPIIIGNNDFALYTSTSNAVKYFGEEITTSISGISSMWVYGHQPRMINYWIAFASSIFDLDIFNSAYIIMIYVYALVPIAVGILIERISRRFTIGAIGSLIMFFNCNLQYIFFEGFIGQIASIIYMVFLTFLFWQMIDEGVTCWKTSALAGIVLAGMASVYSEMVPIIIGAIVLSVICQLIAERKKALYLVFNCLIVAGTMALIFPHGYSTVISMLKVSDAAKVGWDIDPGYLLQSLGIYNSHFWGVTGEVAWNQTILGIFSCIGLVFLLMFILRKFKGGQRRVLFCFTASFTAFYLFFLFHYDKYKAFKGLMNMSYIFITLMVISICFWYIYSKRKFIPVFVGTLALLFIIHNGIETYFVDVSYSEAIKKDKHLLGNAITDDHLELTNYFDNTDYKIIYFGGAPYWDALVALTTGLQEGVITNDLNNYLWNDIGQIPEGAIAVDTSSCPEPFKIYGETALKNTVYEVKIIDTLYPFCINRQEFSSVISQWDGSHFNSYRKLKNQVSTMRFYVREECHREMEIHFSCSNEARIIINTQDKEKQYYASAGENIIKLEDVHFLPGANNEIIISYEDDALELCITGLYFDGIKENPKTDYVFANFEKYKWITFGSMYEKVTKLFSKESEEMLPSSSETNSSISGGNSLQYKNNNDLQGENTEAMLLSSATKISFVPGGNWAQYINNNDLQGEEPTGQWCRDKITFSLELEKQKEILMNFDAWAYKDYKIHLICNGQDVGIVSIDYENNNCLKPVVIPSIYTQSGLNEITFIIDNTTSPYANGEGEDRRNLGIHFSCVRISFQ